MIRLEKSMRCWSRKMAMPKPANVVNILEAFLPEPEVLEFREPSERDGLGAGLGMPTLRIIEMYESHGAASYAEVKAINPLKAALAREPFLMLYAQLRRAALEHDADALNDLGWLWLDGHTLIANPSIALHLFRLAAADDLSEAFFNLGQLYTYGIGVAIDEHMAQRWLKKAFKGGIREAALEVAWLYDARDREGSCAASRVEADYRKAFRWYRKAARAGDTAAFARLGKSYLEGNGVSRHVSKGLFWLQRAALSGDAAAADALEYFYEDALYMPDPQGLMRLFWASYAEDLRATEWPWPGVT
jgi:TPR repeat protein